MVGIPHGACEEIGVSGGSVVMTEQNRPDTSVESLQQPSPYQLVPSSAGNRTDMSLPHQALEGRINGVERIEREAGFQPWFDVQIRVEPENSDGYPVFKSGEPVIILRAAQVAEIEGTLTWLKRVAESAFIFGTEHHHIMQMTARIRQALKGG